MRRVKIDAASSDERRHGMSAEEWEADLDHDRLKPDESVRSFEEWEADEREIYDLDRDLSEMADDEARQGFLGQVSETLTPDVDADYLELERRLSDYGSADALGLRGGRWHFKEDADTEALSKDGTDWLRANDPELTPEGIRAELNRALSAEGISLDDACGASGAFPNGKPNAGARALRVKVRNACLLAYEDGRRRVLMADTLGCSRQALHNLMTSPPKP